MDIPGVVTAAGLDLRNVIVAGRARSVAAVDNLAAAIDVHAVEASYLTAEPAAVAAIAATQRRAGEQGITTAQRAAGGWSGVEVATSVIPEVPDGLLTPAGEVATLLRQTVLSETLYRIGTGVQPADAVEHARLRGGRTAAELVAGTARRGHTSTLQKAGLGWARIPTTGACPFCLLMASRGPVYRTQQTAQGRTGHYHPWDRCTTLAVPRGTTLGDYLGGDVAELVHQADADYRRGDLTVTGRKKTQSAAVNPIDPRQARALADRLEQSAARMEAAGLPDAAAEARRRAAELRAQADSEPADGPSIYTPRAGGSGGRSGSGGGRGRGPEGWSGPGRIPDGWPTSKMPADGGLPGVPIAIDTERPQRRRTAPELADIEHLLIPDYWVDPEEVDIADWLLAHGYTIQRVRRHKQVQGKRSPDSVIVLGDGRQTVEWKTSQATDPARIGAYLNGGQATRYIVRLTRRWSRAGVEQILREAMRTGEGLVEEITFITPDDVFRWRG